MVSGFPQLLITDKAQSVLQGSPERPVDCVGSYTPFGWTSAGAIRRHALGFNGQIRERSTTSYHLGAGYRVFNPVLMRFSSPDNRSPFGRGGLNCYAFCAGDPINRRDNNGHVWSWLQRMFGGAGDDLGGAIGRRATIPGIGSASPDIPFQFSGLMEAHSPNQVAPSIFTWKMSQGRNNVFGITMHGNELGEVAYDSSLGQVTHIENVYSILSRQGVDFSRYDTILLQSCFGGRGGELSNGARLSGLTNRPVVTFNKLVTGTGMSGSDAWQQYFSGLPSDMAYPRIGYRGTTYSFTIDPIDSGNVSTFGIRRA